jgi:hypothetical protein
MVQSTKALFTKNEMKIPVSSHSEHAKKKREDELLVLQTKNKVLIDALKSIQNIADEQIKKNFDLVWFARNRSRFPNHAASKRIETSEEHHESISKLRSKDGDFHHGFNSGLLAAARMFKDHADIAHVSNKEKDEIVDVVSSYAKKIEKSKQFFPNLETEKFPEEKSE